MWDFINSREVTAAKPHRCAECRQTIEKGQRHIYVAGKVEGELNTYRLDLDCDLITSEYIHAEFDGGDGFPLGEVRNELLSEHGITDALAWAQTRRAERIPAEAAQRAQRVQKSVSTTVGLEIVNERLRQVVDEGWTAAHDDKHTEAQIAMAASAYALQGAGDLAGFEGEWPFGWGPLPAPKNDTRRALVIAGALIIAEIERLDRKTAAAEAIGEAMPLASRASADAARQARAEGWLP